MSKTHEVTVEQPEKFMPVFLAILPVPIDDDPESKTYNQPLFTDDEWYKEWLIRESYRAYIHGKDKMAKETSVKESKETLFKCKKTK